MKKIKKLFIIGNEKVHIENFFKVITYPFCFKKLKLIIALLLPKLIQKKIKTY